MKGRWFIVAMLVVVVALALAVPALAGKTPPAPKAQDYYAGFVTYDAATGTADQHGFTGYTVERYCDSCMLAGVYSVAFPAGTFTYGAEIPMMMVQQLGVPVLAYRTVVGFSFSPDGSAGFQVAFYSETGQLIDVPWYFQVIASPGVYTPPSPPAQ